jgi:hypothetical protein
LSVLFVGLLAPTLATASRFINDFTRNSDG